jgi:hypothetical protein
VGKCAHSGTCDSRNIFVGLWSIGDFLSILQSNCDMSRALPMTKREFFGEFYLWALQDYEKLRAYRNEIAKRKPTEEEMLVLKLNKPWERFYGAIL